MIDSHCHLTDPRLFEQLDDVLARAREAGVTEIVTIGTDPADAEAAIAVCERHDMVRCAIGIHPNEAGSFDVDAVARIAELASHPSVVALGEMGLDFYWDKVDRTRQERVFRAQLDLATAMDRPVVIHSRSAIAQTLSVLADYPAVRCVFHCFTGSAEEVEAVVAAGHHVGFTGPITFRKNDDLREVVRRTPVDRILVETDGPYLSPEPLRSKKICEPAFVRHTLATAGQVKQLLFTEIDAITTENTRRFYRMQPIPAG